MEEQILEPAQTTYKDWVGTAAAEGSVIKGSGNLWDLAGLDHRRWSILAVDMYTFSHGQPSQWTVKVCAFDREAHGVEGHNDLRALEADQGSIPVTEILLHGVSLEDVVRCMKVLHVQLISPRFQRLNVVERTDYPVQE